jgi:steroid delta-isomerase-like uncharacterized protein
MVFRKTLHQIVDQERKFKVSSAITLRDQGQERSYFGARQVEAWFAMWFEEAFDNSRLEIDQSVSSPRQTFAAFTFYGTHQAAFLGIPATGRMVCLPMVLLVEAAECQIQTISLYYNSGTLLRQLGFGP